MTNSNIILILFVACLSFSSCREDNSVFISDDITDTVCNGTAMQIKRIQSTTDENEYIKAEWNADGTIKMINMNLAFSEKRTANYVYENGRIIEAILNNNINDPEPDTAVFHYNTDGKVDSMYLKVGRDEYNSSIKLTYTDGKLKRLTGYTGADTSYYFDIETDENQNITKSIEYQNDGTSFIKESTYTYTWDKKKNPLKDLAVYMLYLDESNTIFQHWGKNNYTDQRYVGHNNVEVDMTTGTKFKYNDHCYPVSYKSTIFGTVILDEDAFIYTYY